MELMGCDVAVASFPLKESALVRSQAAHPTTIEAVGLLNFS